MVMHFCSYQAEAIATRGMAKRVARDRGPYRTPVRRNAVRRSQTETSGRPFDNDQDATFGEKWDRSSRVRLLGPMYLA